MPHTIITLVLAALCLAGCAAKTTKPAYLAEVELVSKEPNAITLKSVGLGANRQEAATNAQHNAFNVLLFRGLPDNSPLVVDEAEARAKHQAYFQRFFSGGQYKTFMVGAAETSEPSRTKEGVRIYVNVQVNTGSLRRDLEQNGIVRKFGF
jgi:hypothetical protein